MKADGKSLDDRRNLLVDEEVFNKFIASPDLSLEEASKLHKNFNLPDIILRFPDRDKDDRKRTEQSFLVPFNEIKGNEWDLSINRYKEIIYEEEEYDDPRVILERIEKLDEERNNLIKSIIGL